MRIAKIFMSTRKKKTGLTGENCIVCCFALCFGGLGTFEGVASFFGGEGAGR